MTRSLAIFVLLAGFGWAPVGADGWQSEKNFYKRVEKGLETADAQLDEARKIYREGDPYKAQEQMELSLDTTLEAYQIIVDSGEDMRKRAVRFKKVEIQMRGILRKLEDFNAQVELIDRGPVHRAWQTVSQMQDQLLKSMFQGGTLPPAERVK